MIPSKLVPFLLIISLLVLVAGCSSSSSSSSLLPAALTGSPASFEGVINVQMTSSSGNSNMIYSIKMPMVRIDLPGGMFAISDQKTGISRSFIPSNKMYMEMNFSDMANIVKPKSYNPKIESTGKRETIAGIECEHYIVTDATKTDMCVAKNFIANGDMAKFFRDMTVPDELKNGGFPLKVEMQVNGKPSTILVTSIDRKKLDDSLFAMPAGYKKMDMPKMPGINQ